MAKLILVRHGQSQWNLENRFTGWIDIPLTDTGREEARRAGEQLQDIHIDQAFTSVLNRAIETLEIALGSAEQPDVPIIRDQAINERMYGDLQGLNKDEVAAQHGAAQVKIWRRSYDIAPPNGESLKDTAARAIPYFEQHILPVVKSGKNVLVSAHGNSLRAIVMKLDNLSQAEVLELNIPNGVPIIYEIDNDGSVISKKQFD